MENTSHIDGTGNIIIQGITDSTITINPNNSTEVRQLIIDLGTRLSELPKNVLEMLNEKQDINSEIKTGANIQFSLLADIYPDKELRKLKFGVSIVSLTKENRFFNRIFFKVSPKFTFKDGVEMDTFTMEPQQQNAFPKKLEYGEPHSLSYEIKDGAFKSYEEILGKDENAYIQAFCNTTVGELYESNKVLISHIFERLKWLMQ